jgi:hypothetical protein
VAEIGLSDSRSFGGIQTPNFATERIDERNDMFSDGFSPARYYVRMRLDTQPTWVRHGSGGVARIVTGQQTIAQMIQRFCHRVFRFHF